VVVFERPAEKLMATEEAAECPFCLEQMQIEERDGKAWLFCPNGCPTESEVILRKPPGMESETDAFGFRTRSGGSSA